MSVKNKTEKAFKEYLKPLTKRGKALHRVDMNGAHKDGERVLPALEIWAGSAVERDDLPPGSGEYDVSLTLRLLTQADDDNRDKEDKRIDALDAYMCDISAIQSLMNYPNGKRPVAAYYVQAIYPDARESGADERTYVEEMEYTVVCRNDNGQG